MHGCIHPHGCIQAGYVDIVKVIIKVYEKLGNKRPWWDRYESEAQKALPFSRCF
jgi:hypothetical protein